MHRRHQVLLQVDLLEEPLLADGAKKAGLFVALVLNVLVQTGFVFVEFAASGARKRPQQQLICVIWSAHDR